MRKDSEPDVLTPTVHVPPLVLSVPVEESQGCTLRSSSPVLCTSVSSSGLTMSPRLGQGRTLLIP